MGASRGEGCQSRQIFSGVTQCKHRYLNVVGGFASDSLGGLSFHDFSPNFSPLGKGMELNWPRSSSRGGRPEMLPWEWRG